MKNFNKQFPCKMFIQVANKIASFQTLQHPCNPNSGAGMKEKSYNNRERESTSSQEKDDHNIGEDVKVTPELMHSCEGRVLAQQIGQTSPIFMDNMSHKAIIQTKTSMHVRK